MFNHLVYRATSYKFKFQFKEEYVSFLALQSRLILIKTIQSSSRFLLDSYHLGVSFLEQKEENADCFMKYDVLFKYVNHRCLLTVNINYSAFGETCM